jgi:DNA-binding NarL/FixJ family response regulator
VSSREASKPSLLVADRAATRLGVQIAVDGVAHVCAEAVDAEHAITALREQPDVCIVGLEIPAVVSAERGRRYAAEAQVLAARRRGQSTAVIAQPVAIAPVTVRRSIAATTRKTGAGNRRALARSSA